MHDHGENILSAVVRRLSRMRGLALGSRISINDYSAHVARESVAAARISTYL